MDTPKKKDITIIAVCQKEKSDYETFLARNASSIDEGCEIAPFQLDPNLAMQRARGEILVMAPVRSTLEAGAIETVRGAFTKTELGALGGRLRPLAEAGKLARIEALAQAYGPGPAGGGNLYSPLVAFRRRALMEAGGFSSEAEGQHAYRALEAGLESTGWETSTEKGFSARYAFADSWPGVLKAQYEKAKSWSLESQHARGGFPAPVGPLQCLFFLLSIGFLVALGPARPGDALTLAAVCFMLNYYPNRPFLRFVAGKEPELVMTAVGVVLFRPAAWIIGLAQGVIMRLLSKG